MAVTSKSWKGYPADVDGTRWCRDCREFKNVEEFRIHTTNGKPRRQCNDCEAAERLTDNSRFNARHRTKRWRLSGMGMTEEEYEHLLDAQNSRCPICLRIKSLVIDHDHETGLFRGLICQGCNTAIGKLQEDPATFLRAIQYLEGGR